MRRAVVVSRNRTFAAIDRYVGGSLFLCFAAHAFFFGSPETGM